MNSHENFYHCVMCRNVVLLEREMDKLMHRCEVCEGPHKHFKIEVNEAKPGFDVGSSRSRL